jgi:UDP-GlcNAc:undecaprenyl-phosphate GlcNAc-1-phosphate transferase
MLLNLALAGAILGFLRFNWTPAVIFMGDAGSLCLGFSLSFMAIALTQGESTLVRPIIALLVLAVPISDTIVVMTKRICHKKSPFKPDQTHLHHSLVGQGFDGKQTVKTILFLCVLLSSLSIVGVVFHVSETLLFIFFVCYFILNWQADLFVGKLVKFTTIFQRREKPQNCPSIIHSAFRRLKANRFFRGATRYDVELEAEIIQGIDLSKQVLSGTIINISKTGLLAQIDGLGFVCKECVITIFFPAEEELNKVAMRTEHLWMSSKAGKQYHGFRFLDLTKDQSDVLQNFLNIQ